MGIKDELKRMSSAIFGGEEEAIVTKAASTDAPSTDAIATDAPTTDIPVEEFTTDAPGTSVPTTEAPDDNAKLLADMEILKAENEALKNPKPPEPTDAPSTDAPILDEDFLGDIDLDELTRDPAAFNKLLNDVYKKGLSTAVGTMKTSSNEVLGMVPGLVTSNVSALEELQKANDDFYSDNEDLTKFKQVVGVVFGELAGANPDKSIPDTLALVGDEVRSRLNLTKPKPTKNKGPKLPKSKGNVRPQSTESKGIASEIDAMNKAL